ncbi:MAG: fibrillin, partial [Oscillatoriales cyanobacterium SM2_2_1]|nr:fibrillin [Oscillatoriales cyanobacterium SM2_2_1]
PPPPPPPELLEGNWLLLFTTSQDLLGFDRLPGVRLGSIYQCIRTAESRIYNIAELYSLPLLEGLVAVRATFSPETEQRVKVTFDRFLIGSQRLLRYRTVDELIQQLSQPTKLPGIDNAITRTNQKGTLETTYLDDELRLGRGNNDNLFILRKVKNFGL